MEDRSSEALFTSISNGYVLPAFLSVNELHEMEDKLLSHGATLVYDILQSRTIFGNLTKERRARFELQSRGLTTEGITHQDRSTPRVGDETDQPPVSKRVRLSSDFRGDLGADTNANDIIRVIRIEWIRDSLANNSLLPIENFVVYTGKPTARTLDTANEKQGKLSTSNSDLGPVTKRSPTLASEELRRAVQKAQSSIPSSMTFAGKREFLKHAMEKEFQGRKFVSSTQRKEPLGSHLPPLLHESTTEHDEEREVALPPMPQWVTDNIIYACQRSTPAHPPNEEFIDLLKKIRQARILLLDEIAVRAYSTSIASIAAYPYNLQSWREVSLLPGCDKKVVELFIEWKSTGQLEAVQELETDHTLAILQGFYDIWGVGALTARDWYFNKGWQSQSDIIENGWTSLSRAQQIGIKYFEEFKMFIKRTEVEYIASVITYHAKHVIDDGIESIIVGGYRRGNSKSGDVDIILTHRDESKTKNIIEPVIDSLESAGWVTHVLRKDETNSLRDQETLPYMSTYRKRGGFDTLDKAFLVWQDPTWLAKSDDPTDESGDSSKNPNPHRRVDIIISPWKTIGCAVAGWTSGTTFQRDLRRYAKAKKGWKFDSSGVRERGTGKWIDLEGWTDPIKGKSATWLEAEKRVFEGFGLLWRDPNERCTG
ncbi:hypothetical protein MMC25_004229 [Agyrium rufum]|nr:hypothetical protein [Agyrium rufum]